MGAITNLLKKEWKGDRVVWIGEYFTNDVNVNPKVSISYIDIDCFYELISPETIVVSKGFHNNLTKSISIDLSKVTAVEKDGDDFMQFIHPLSILTACGEGSGFNDAKHYLAKLEGTWAGDNLSVTDKPQFQTRLFFNNVPQSIEFITEEETETMMSAIKNVTEALTKHKTGGTRMATLKKATKKATKKSAPIRVAKKAPAKKTPAKKTKATKILAKVKLSNRKVAKKAKTVRKETAKRTTKEAPPIANPIANPVVDPIVN